MDLPTPPSRSDPGDYALSDNRLLKAVGSTLDRMKAAAFYAWKQDVYPPSEWRVHPAVCVEIMNACDNEGQFIIKGPSGVSKFMGIDIVSDPDVEEFELRPIGQAS